MTVSVKVHSQSSSPLTYQISLSLSLSLSTLQSGWAAQDRRGPWVQRDGRKGAELSHLYFQDYSRSSEEDDKDMDGHDQWSRRIWSWRSWMSWFEEVSFINLSWFEYDARQGSIYSILTCFWHLESTKESIFRDKIESTLKGKRCIVCYDTRGQTTHMETGILISVRRIQVVDCKEGYWHWHWCCWWCWHWWVSGL